MGKGIVDELKKEFQIEDIWLPLEIHPETPIEGKPISSMFPENRLEAMISNLNAFGNKYGIKFNNLSILSNSKYSLLAGEFAKEHKKFHEYHDAIFRAYFTEGKDIGKLSTILQILTNLNLDSKSFEKSLNDNRYDKNLENTQKLAEEYGISSTPTFIINNKHAIVGAQSIDSFREILKNME